MSVLRKSHDSVFWKEKPIFFFFFLGKDLKIRNHFKWYSIMSFNLIPAIIFWEQVSLFFNLCFHVVLNCIPMCNHWSLWCDMSWYGIKHRYQMLGHLSMQHRFMMKIRKTFQICWWHVQQNVMYLQAYCHKTYWLDINNSLYEESLDN